LDPVLSQMNALLLLDFIHVEPTLILFVQLVQSFSSDLFPSVDYTPPECKEAHALDKYQHFEETCFLHIYNNNII
jgi:hypothetical protein